MRLKFISLTLLVTLFASITIAACSSTDDPVTPQDSGPEVNDSNQIPCAARRVLQQVCQQCHGKPLKEAAPFPILTRADMFKIYQGRVIRALVVEQLNTRRMPVEPVTMNDTQRQELLDWVNAGAYAVAAQVCAEPAGDAGPEGGDAGSLTDADANIDAD
jgi:hypothetical protein